MLEGYQVVARAKWVEERHAGALRGDRRMETVMQRSGMVAQGRENWKRWRRVGEERTAATRCYSGHQWVQTVQKKSAGKPRG